MNEENLLSNHRSSTSYFSIQPIYFQLIQIFEHLGKSLSLRRSAKEKFHSVRYYIKLDQIEQSEECLKELSLINPFCHQMFFLRGLIFDARGQLKLAKQSYNDTLAINPSHFPTLIQLTKLLIQLGNYSLAEKYARDATALQPANYQPWSLLTSSLLEALFRLF